MSNLMSALTLGHYLTLGAVIFCISVAGIFLNRKNVIMLLISLELMLLSVNINFVAFSRSLGDAAGQVFVFFILTVAAAEAPLADNAAVAAGVPNTTWLARALFTDFMLPFEVAAVILTVAVVAAVMLTLRRRPGARHQDPSEQVRVRVADRVRLVKMQAEVPAADAKPEEGAQ